MVGWLAGTLPHFLLCARVCATVCSLLSETLRDKEHRAQQRLSRCTEERGKKLDEQRRRETERRAAADHRRRQQQEAQKVRGQLGWQLTPVGADDSEVFVPHFAASEGLTGCVALCVCVFGDRGMWGGGSSVCVD